MRVLFPPRTVLSKSPITFFDQIKIQKSTRLGSTKKTWISKFSEFQEFWWEFCFPPKSSIENLYDFFRSTQNPKIYTTEVPKILNFKIFRVPGAQMRVLFPPRRVLSKIPMTFFDQLKIQKATRLWSTQKISNFKIFRFPGVLMRILFLPQRVL